MNTPFYFYNVAKPNRITTPEKQKDQQYHLNYGRYCIGAMNHPSYRIFQTKSLINWNFYQNRQWSFKEDLESFLMDESGDVRNRVRWQRNIIQPMIQELIGNTIRTDFACKVFSVTDHVVNRRESELNRLKFWSRQAQASPELKETIQKNVPIGDTEDETEQIFENLWVDSVERNMNNLDTFISEVDNNLDADKIEWARNLALCGLGIEKGTYINGTYKWSSVDPQFFGFDYGAQKKDLTDAEYMWELHFMDGATIIENWQPNRKDAMQIESFGTRAFENYQSLFFWVAGGVSTRMPVFEVYWKDIQKQEYGYVRDPFGYEMLTRINSEDGKYTNKDLIYPSQPIPADIEITKKNLSVDRYVDVVRFCEFVATDYFSSQTDIALNWGVMKYQETNLLNPSRSELPYKCSCWDFHNGLILAPVDVLIDSQRLINRVISMAEARISNSSGDFDIIDRAGIDSQIGEEGTRRDMRLSKTVVVDTRGRGVANVIQRMSSSIGPDVDTLFNVSDRLKMASTDITGVDERIAGTQGNAHSHAITNGQPIGTLANENFFYCIGNIFEQIHQSNCTRGKRIYIDSPRKLAIMTGDRGAEEITLTRDMNLEEFRCVVRRTGSEEMEKLTTNATLLQMYSAQLIAHEELVNYYGHSTADDIPRALKDSYKRKQVASKIQMQQQQVVQQKSEEKQGQLMEQAQNEKNTMIQLALEKEERDKQQRLKEISLRGIITLQKTREQLRVKQRENEQKNRAQAKEKE